MTVPWSLTITAPARVRTITGIADDQEGAVAAALAAARADIEDAAGPRGTGAARYDLHAGEALVAIVQAGADRADAGALLDRLIAQHRADGSLGRAIAGPGEAAAVGAGLSDRAGHH